MINHIYIDNYKSFVNFKYQPDSFQLILGDNGSGKTTLFDVLERIRDFATAGVEAKLSFPPHTRTAWDSRTEQTFELGLSTESGHFSYRIVVSHDLDSSETRIKAEHLGFEGKFLYSFDGHEVQLFNDDFTANPRFPFDASRSPMATIPKLPTNRRLIEFRSHLTKIYFFSPDPIRMLSVSEIEIEIPDRPMAGLVAWLRHMSQESMQSMARLRDNLSSNVFEGLTNIRLEKVTDKARVLRFEFESSSDRSHATFSLMLDQLSDGQRQLVALYSILEAAVRKGTVICIDEPENYVALREMQPWLIELKDRVTDTGCQCLLISHHPEFIDYLADKNGLIFERDGVGPTRTNRFEYRGDEPLTPSEYVARGWQ